MSALTVLLRVAWRTVAAIVGLIRFGVDEMSVGNGHRFLTVVVDHGGRSAGVRGQAATRKLWASYATRAALLTHVSCHGAERIHALARQRAPKVLIGLFPFHVVAWPLKTPDKVRARTMTKAGVRDRHAIWTTRKNPPDVTCEQRTGLAEIAVTTALTPGVPAQRATARGLSDQRPKETPAACGGHVLRAAMSGYSTNTGCSRLLTYSHI
ncbi:transposase [Mycobacterium attenuatum]|uniref:transposase n=1 Tax=Mycobacterium attenuatum TaxID=2341086 RepID=UPI000F025374|nr:transposase [Mycobacterium attenuatum]